MPAQAAPPKKVNFSAKLKTLGTKWADARDRAKNDPDFNRGIIHVDDGSYIARLMNAELGVSKGKGKLQVISSFVIVKGDWTGSEVKRFDGLEEENSLPYLVKYLDSLKVDTDNFSLEELEAKLAELTETKPFYRITLKTRKAKNPNDNDFQSVWIDRQVDVDPAELDGDGTVLAQEGGQEAAATVTWNLGDKVNAPYEGIDPGEQMFEASVVALNDDGTVTVQYTDDQQAIWAADQLQAFTPEEVPAETGGVEVVAGTAVSFKFTDGKRYLGKIISIAPDNSFVNVKPDKPIPGLKSPTFKVTDIASLEAPAA